MPDATEEPADHARTVAAGGPARHPRRTRARSRCSRCEPRSRWGVLTVGKDEHGRDRNIGLPLATTAACALLRFAAAARDRSRSSGASGPEDTKRAGRLSLLRSHVTRLQPCQEEGRTAFARCRGRQPIVPRGCKGPSRANSSASFPRQASHDRGRARFDRGSPAAGDRSASLQDDRGKHAAGQSALRPWEGPRTEGSLAAFLLSLLYTYVLTDGGAVMGRQMAIMSAVIAGLLVFFGGYARSMTLRGTLR